MATQMTGTPTHTTGTRDEWLAARLELLDAEKDLTRRADELAKRRQELPWVRIDKPYRFETDEGSASLGGSLPRALAAPHLSLHVRARLQGGLPVLLGDRGRVQRVRRPPRQPRRHADGGVAGAAREAAGVQAAHGVDVPLGVVVSQRLQRRLQRLVHRGAAARRPPLQLPAREAAGDRPGRQRQGAGRALRGDDRHGCRRPTRASGRA